MKEKYITPTIEVIEVENEGVMASSGTGNIGGNVGNGGSMFGTTTRSGTRSNPHATSTLGELEDLINDILTVEGK